MARKRKQHSPRRECGRSKRQRAISQWLKDVVELKREFDQDKAPGALQQ